MSLQIDTRTALRTPNALAQLLFAVTQASANDELDWIEWKSGLPLSDRTVQGTIARHILGMANRRPDQARLHAEGCGYLVIGAEPGKVTGVHELDPANLTNAIRPYLGAEGPMWTPGYVREVAVPVLVIVVNAPRPGDRMFTLEKQLTVRTPGSQEKTYLAGTIFVRHHGQTVQAGPGDVRALEARLLAPRREAEEHRLLMEMSRLVNGVLDKAEPYASSAGELDLPELLLLWHMISGHEDDYPAIYPAVSALSGARLGFEVFAAAKEAIIQIEAQLFTLEAEMQWS